MNLCSCSILGEFCYYIINMAFCGSYVAVHFRASSALKLKVCIVLYVLTNCTDMKLGVVNASIK